MKPATITFSKLVDKLQHHYGAPAPPPESFGYTVLTAPNVRAELELAAVYPVDVVIVDCLMPEMNGESLYSR